MQKERVTIHICSKDRHSELALLLQSLRTQSFQDFDIIILDDSSGTPILHNHFLNSIITRMKLENHKFKMIRNDTSFGCCAARNKCIAEDTFDNEFCMRLDDDVILEHDYIEKLLEGINAGLDMVTGVVPLISQPELIREAGRVGNIMNEHKLDKEGNLIMNKDECGFCYDDDLIFPTHQFRTNCLYKSEINKKIQYPNNLSTVAFREEGFFSFGAILEGYKIGVHTGAVCWHLQTPSGGNRRPDYDECVALDEDTWRKWVKKKFDKHGDFLNKNKEDLNENN